MLYSLLTLASFLVLTIPISALPKQSHVKHAMFTLHDITYSSETIYSTPAHLAVADATIAFNLTNTAVPYMTYCSASSTREFDFFYADIVYKCDPPAGAPAGATANFTFNEPDGTFNVNQTWTKHGETSLGYGSGKAPIVYTTDVYQNPNWTIGQIYTSTIVKGSLKEFQIKPTVEYID